MNSPLLSCIAESVDLKSYSWFGVGGKTKFLAKPANNTEFQEVILFAQERNLAIKVIGLGANVLFSDAGFDGIIIMLPKEEIKYVYLDDDWGLLTVSAGISIEQAIDFCLNKALLFGLEEFSGIPSSVGGALFINLHYFEFLIAQFVFEATIYDTKNKKTTIVAADWFSFGYNDSKVKSNNQYIILSATFRLKRGDLLCAAYAKGRSKEIIRHRKMRYPNQHTCGCFFKNFSEKQIQMNEEGKKILAAGYYLEKVGIKGDLKIGSSFVSTKHANMISHNGDGTATEIITIARIMQEKVYEKFQLLLEPECELIGFHTYPLLTLDTIQMIHK